ncbi:unnamed protein product, partial [Ixodes persulcatus]
PRRADASDAVERGLPLRKQSAKLVPAGAARGDFFRWRDAEEALCCSAKKRPVKQARRRRATHQPAARSLARKPRLCNSPTLPAAPGDDFECSSPAAFLTTTTTESTKESRKKRAGAKGQPNRRLTQRSNNK